MLQVLICGILGHMGQHMLAVCQNDPDTEVLGGIDQVDSVTSGIPVYSSFSSCDCSPDVVIDFSNPASTDAIIEYCRKTGTALVMCTTGHTEDQQERLRALADDVPVFISANMSIGIALLRSLAVKASLILGERFDIEIVERHHNRKLDAPSGTAKILADDINRAAEGKFEYAYDRHSVSKKRDKREIGIHSVRGGTIVGDHEVLFCGDDELLSLSHQSTSRVVFAAGALKAAKFIRNLTSGLYNMDSIIESMQ